MIKMLFCGDFAPTRGYTSLVSTKLNEVFGDARSLIKSADVSFVNLECPLTDSVGEAKKSGPVLSASKSCAAALTDFSVVGVANNHILDKGTEGLADTIQACEKENIRVIGAGLTPERALQPAHFDIKGLKVSVIALAEREFNCAENGEAGVALLDPIANYFQVKSAKEMSDILIVTIHGGNEYFPYPRPGLRKFCHFLIELGVDAVVCHHSHVPGAMEYYKGAPIVYSLGNFIFDNEKSPKGWDLGYMLELTFNTETTQLECVRRVLYKQGVKYGGVCYLGADEEKEFTNALTKLDLVMMDSALWRAEWMNFVNKKSNRYIAITSLPFWFKGLGYLSEKLSFGRLLLGKGMYHKKINMLRCDSHREVLMQAMELRGKQFRG